MARDDAGVAAIEFAVYATVFLMITAATVDIGLLLFTQSELDAAVGAGAQFAAHGDATAASIAAIVDNANGAGWASSTVSVNNSDATRATARLARRAAGAGAALEATARNALVATA